MTASCRELQSAEDRVPQTEGGVLKSESCRLSDLQGVRLATMESERPVSGQVLGSAPSKQANGEWFC